jgi:hypothetical protein
MKPFQMFSCSFFLACFALAGLTNAEAQTSPTTSTVSVQFPQYYQHGVVNPLSAGNHTAGVVPLNNWNLVDTDTGRSPVAAAAGSLIDSTGASTSVSLIYSGYNLNDGTNVSNFPAPVWYQAGGLADEYLAGGSSFSTTGTPISLTLSGLNSTDTYKLIAYVSAPWWANNGTDQATVSVGSTTYYVTTSKTLPGWTLSSSSIQGPPATGNYVVFNGLTGSTSQTLTLVGTDVGLGGFQLLDQGTTTPPTTPPITPPTTPPITPPTTPPTTTSGIVTSVQLPQYYAHAVVDPMNMNGNNYTAGVVPANNWNVADSDTGTKQATLQTLINQNGATSGLSFVYSGYTYNDGNNTTSFPTPLWYVAGGLTDVYIAQATSFNQGSGGVALTVSGLTPSHSYDLIAYVASPVWANSGTETAAVTVGTSTVYLKTSNTLSGWTQGTATSANNAAPANYVRFSGLTGAATQTLTIPTQYVGLGGFQIVDNGAATGSSGASAPTGIVNSSTVPAGYSLTFDDEFATLSISDTDGAGTNWYAKTEQCCMYDTTNNLPTAMAGITDGTGKDPFSLVAGGGLDIRLQKTNNAWYSGVLTTVDNKGNGFSQQYGYFEMKAKFPPAAGTWPAFWLLNTAAKASGADAGEIDILESYMQFPYTINTRLHNWSTAYINGNNGDSTEFYQQYTSPSDLSAAYHVYGMLWTASTMTFYVDGLQVYSTPTPTNMNQPYYPIIDLGLGGGWPTGSTPAVNDMLVQYVRVYAPS